MPYTNETLGTEVRIFEKTPVNGLAVLVSGRGVPTTDGNQYATGCLWIDRVASVTYQNRGTTAVPAWVAQVSGAFQTVSTTNGTTAVNIFDANGAPAAMQIKSVYVVSLDTTAGNITVQQGTNVVATIAKGTAAGALVGAVTLANTTYAKGDVATVLSSSAGNAQVFITWQAV